jgi:hypothetical protein
MREPPPKRQQSLVDTASTKLRSFMSEVWRVRWMIVIAVAVVWVRAKGILPETSATLLVLYKPSLAAIGFIAAHIGYQQAFPYIDQEKQLFGALRSETAEDRERYALLFIGTSILRGMIYAAFVLGVTLGL